MKRHRKTYRDPVVRHFHRRRMEEEAIWPTDSRIRIEEALALASAIATGVGVGLLLCILVINLLHSQPITPQ